MNTATIVREWDLIDFMQAGERFESECCGAMLLRIAKAEWSGAIGVASALSSKKSTTSSFRLEAMFI